MREVISDKQGITLVVLYILGSSLILAIGAEAGNDVWLSLIIAIFFAIPVLLVYARLHALFPDKNIFDISKYVYGRLFGNLINLLFTWFALHLGSLVLRNFVEFITIVGLPETPDLVPASNLILLTIWVVKEGIEVLGRWGEFFVLVSITLLLFAFILLTPQMDSTNLLPILYNGIKPVIGGAFAIFAFPFVELVTFMMVFSSLKNRQSSYKIFLIGLLIGGFVLLVTVITDLLILGADNYSELYFPLYMSISKINVGNFLQRLEIIAAVTFLIGGFVKISICLMGVCNGFVNILGSKDYRFIVTPLAFLMLNMSFMVYDSIMEMTTWASQLWRYYAFPFQVLLPVIILIGAEVKLRLQRKCTLS